MNKVISEGRLSELDIIVEYLGHNWLTLLFIVLALWVVLTKLVESSEAAAKLLGPVGRRIIKGYQQRQRRFREDVATEAKLMAIELVPKIIPGDYQVVKDQLQNIISRVGELEMENRAMRAFVVVDEEWHFRFDLAKAHGGPLDLPARTAWPDFLAQWKEGWRPDAYSIKGGAPPGRPPSSARDGAG